ncbi:MAG: triphosphoribosyl-dephospho-CoA synthase [Planctomycetaceae bacterium]
MADQSDKHAAIHTACLLEATARKPGNVHPLAAFADCDWETFAVSAEAIAPVLAGAASRPLGESILRAVEATQTRVGRNTNLGMILLLAPLAAVPEDQLISIESIAGVLDRTTVEDCRLVYEAIRRAHPGGLGSTKKEDVAAAPTVTLVEAMRLAADRDAVARQYANGFADVLAWSVLFTAADVQSLEGQIVVRHSEMISRGLETLIARKCGPTIAAEATRRAAILFTTFLSNEPRIEVALADFDAWLRADGNRRNPGTTADLIAASLFVAIRDGRIPCFAADEVRTYGDALRRSGGMLPFPASASR